MASLEAKASIFSFYSSSPSSSSTPKHIPHQKPLTIVKLHLSTPNPTYSLKFPIYRLPLLSNFQTRKPKFELCSMVEEMTIEEKPESTQLENQKRKLYVVNFPWSLSVSDIKSLFSECGNVIDVEIIKQKDGRNRGFGFVTMASAEEAQAVIDKFDSHEISGRIIRVDFAKRFKKPPPPPPPGFRPGDTRHKLYVSNLAWKVRSNHLREMFSAEFNPVSARVVFDSPSGRTTGYGFVSFPTREEAESAISALDGKELLGRPIRLKFSEKNTEESGNEKEEEADEIVHEQPQDS